MPTTANRRTLQREIETGYRRGIPPGSDRAGAGMKLSEHQIEKKKQQLRRVEQDRAERKAERERLLSHDVAREDAVRAYQAAHEKCEAASRATREAQDRLDDASRELQRARRQRSDAVADFDAASGSAAALERAEEQVDRLREQVKEIRAEAKDLRGQQVTREEAVEEAREEAVRCLEEHQTGPVRRLFEALEAAREAQAELAEMEAAYSVATPGPARDTPTMQCGAVEKGRVDAWMEEAEDFT